MSTAVRIIRYHEFHKTVPVVTAPYGTMNIMDKGWREQRGMNHGSNEVAIEKSGAWAEIAKIAAEAYEKREGVQPSSLTPCYIFVHEDRTGSVRGAHVYILRGKVCFCG